MCQNKTEDVNLSVFNLITIINELRTLIKHISCKCKCKFDSKKCNSNPIWNNNKCQWDYKNQRKNVYKNGFWNLGLCSCENDKYLESIIIISNSVICKEIIESILKLWKVFW